VPSYNLAVSHLVRGDLNSLFPENMTKEGKSYVTYMGGVNFKEGIWASNSTTESGAFLLAKK
jgi:hypothetical protein